MHAPAAFAVEADDPVISSLQQEMDPGRRCHVIEAGTTDSPAKTSACIALYCRIQLMQQRRLTCRLQTVQHHMLLGLSEDALIRIKNNKRVCLSALVRSSLKLRCIRIRPLPFFTFVNVTVGIYK